MSREAILHRVRTALGRSVGQPPAPAPEAYLRAPDIDREHRIASFRRSLELLAGKTFRASSPREAGEYIRNLIAGRRAVASNSPYLIECGISQMDGVISGITDREELREACASAEVGVTSADYALADTGTLVMLSSAAEARMISLLPPVHAAVVPVDRLLTGLDELFLIAPDPARLSSSMVLITGPSRTADIEQILVRGVHGPGEIHVVIVAPKPET
jgi:L-lactate dehydrogenase complex protein LldG